MSDITKLLEVIRGRSAKSVGLQFPVGLRTKAVELAQDLEREAGVMCLVSADPSFGACDVPDMPVDLTVHLGHAPMPHLRYAGVFLSALGRPPLTDYRFLDAALPLLPRRVGLLTTYQFREWLPAVVAYLEKHGHEVHVGPPDKRVAYAGQLLGCDYHTATIIEKDVDSYLYIGTGDFHPLGVAILVPDKPIIIADTERGEARDLKEVRDHILRQRHAAIARARDAQTFGILVSKKIGQERMGLANDPQALAEEHQRKASLLPMGLASPGLPEGHRVDAW